MSARVEVWIVLNLSIVVELERRVGEVVRLVAMAVAVRVVLEWTALPQCSRSELPEEAVPRVAVEQVVPVLVVVGAPLVVVARK